MHTQNTSVRLDAVSELSSCGDKGKLGGLVWMAE